MRYLLILCLVIAGCATDGHCPPKRPDFSKSKSVRDAEKEDQKHCGCAPVKTSVAAVDSSQVAPVRS